ncbi:MAG: hypothetical protein IT473_13530 [Lysobacter sp.]|nr:hypothetical protein [Lysobacter sp.]
MRVEIKVVRASIALPANRLDARARGEDRLSRAYLKIGEEADQLDIVIPAKAGTQLFVLFSQAGSRLSPG